METNPVQSRSGASRQNTLVIGVILIIAVVAAGVFIMLSSSAPAAQATISDYDSVPQSRLPDGGFVIGNPDAPITIVEYADYACPACQQYLTVTNQVLDEFVKTGQAKFEYRIVPTAGGQLTYFLGQIVVCMEDQKAGSFWKAKDILFQWSMSGRYNENTGRDLARELGVSYEEALACARTQTQVDTDVTLANRLGVTGTPAVMVRYGDGDPEWVTFNGQVLNRGGLPFNILAEVVRSANS